MIGKEELPKVMEHLDFKMMIILYKDKNDSILKLISSTDSGKFVIHPMDVNRLVVPKLEKMASITPIQSNRIDRFSMQTLLYEPAFNEYGDMRRGESD